MKRPQGFDEPGARSEPTPPVSRKDDHGKASGRTPRPRREPRSTPNTGARSAPIVEDADTSSSRVPNEREVRRALREARRERRRVERDEVRRFTLRTRRRRVAWLVAGGTLLVLVLGVVGVGMSPALDLRTIRIVGTESVSAKAVEHSLSGHKGTPLMLLNTSEISQQLAQFPRIRSYSLEVMPPHTLVVHIVERNPVGVIQQQGVFTLVDAANVALSSSKTRPAEYPLITVSGITPGSALSPGFSAAVSVLDALPTTVRSQVDTITATTKDNVTLTLRGSGATVVWGDSGQSDLKAAVLADLLASQPGKKIYDVSSPQVVTTG